jgi:cell division inhibitor SepF
MSGFRKMMTYLGLVDDDEYDDVAYEEAPPPAQQRVMRPVEREPEPLNGIRTLPRERETPPPEARSGVTVTPRPSVVRPIIPTQAPRVHTVTPTTFQDAQEIGDRVKAGVPVIVNLQAVERDLMRRIIDFTSGLMYGLGGDMEKAADRVFLLTPTNVEVSAEEKRRLQERGLYRS